VHWGAAFAIVSCDVLVQVGWFTVDILRQPLKRPLEQIVFLIAAITLVTLNGWGLGIMFRWATAGTGLLHLVVECALWLSVVALVVSLLWNAEIRSRLAAAIPR
jgi:hypothetical protein